MDTDCHGLPGENEKMTGKTASDILQDYQDYRCSRKTITPVFE